MQDGALHLAAIAYPYRKTLPANMIPAGSGTLCAIIPKDSFLATYDVIPLHRLDHVNIYIPSKESLLNQMITDELLRESIQANIIYQGSILTSLSMLTDSQGVIIDEKRIATDHIDPSRFVIRNIEPEISFCYGLQYHTRLDDNEKEFVRFIRNKFKAEQQTK